MREVRKIKILGKNVNVSARTARDVFISEELSKRNGKKSDSKDFLFRHVVIIRDGILANAAKKKLYYRWYFAPRRLIRLLTEKEIYNYAKIILQLEGNDAAYLQYLTGELSESEFLARSKKKMMEISTRTDMKQGH